MAALDRTTEVTLRLERVLVASSQPRAHSTASARAQHRVIFKNNLIAKYKCQDADKGKIKCMVLNRRLPKNIVTAGHILHLEQHECFAPLGLDYMNDKFNSRNGILWHKDIEACYGKQEVVSTQDIFIH